MCGILGSINVNFDISLLDTIKHRGPDDNGMEDYIQGENHIKFAQTRLSIIDLSSAGHQPMHTDCRNLTIVFNGEIYNHKELREKLPGHIQFNGHSDTETILYYIREFGINGIKDFNGIFSIAILKRDAKKLYLVRDPFGVKPLYYHEGADNKLIFSSEIRPIRALLDKSDMDFDALATLLRLRFNPSPETLYANIKKIRPGHYLEVDMSDDKLVFNHYSYISEAPNRINYSSSQALKLYGQKLEDSVKRQLLSDVEIGVLLSGGVDSALVAALAQRHYDGKLKAFTIGFEGKHAEDEISDAAEIAEFLGLEHHFRKISFSDFLEMLKECSRIVEEPLATTSIIPMYFLSELASRKVKVVLTGQGADEPLGGYSRYKSELILKMLPFPLQSIIHSVTKTRAFRNEKIQRGLNCMGLKNDIDRFIAAYEIFNQSDIKRLIKITDRLSVERFGYFYELLKSREKQHPVERMMALDARINLADDLLNYTDKITMNFSLECRVPMLDLDLVNFIESLPYDLKLNLHSGKLIHKRFAETILPYKFISRKKKDFQSPTKNWFSDNTEIIKDVLLTGGTPFSKVFNQDFVREIIDLHQTGFNKEKQIFLLLGLFFKLEAFEEKPVDSIPEFI